MNAGLDNVFIIGLYIYEELFKIDNGIEKHILWMIQPIMQ